MKLTRYMGFAFLSTLLGALLVIGGSNATPVPTPESQSATPIREPACAPRCIDATRPVRRGAMTRVARIRAAQAIQNNPGAAVVINLRAIERWYRQQGRERELPVFYREVLGRSGDPLVRNFINYRLARLELNDQDAKGALDALMRNLDENLQRAGVTAH